MARRTPSDTLSPPSPVQPTPSPPAPPPPPASAASKQWVFGLFGSALLPAGSGSKLPRNWTNNRSATQPRKQEQPQPQGRRQKTGTLAVQTTKSGGERKTDGEYSTSNFAPVVLDRRAIRSGEENGRRHVRAAGLVGKALRVPKQTNIQSQQQQQATTPSTRRGGRRPFSGLSQGQQSWLSSAQR